MPPPDRSAPVIGVIDDDPVMGGALTDRLALEGYRPVWWSSAEAALDGLAQSTPDLLVCDIRLPDMGGDELFDVASRRQALPPVIFMTGYGDINQAVSLVKAGAVDYVTKPFDMTDLLPRIRNAIDRARAAQTPPVGAPLGVSEAMARVAALLSRVADIDSTVLLTGASGVGKEVAARYLHVNSPRAQAPFIAVNCAAIPAALMESELFGHEKGAFTGAAARHRGYAERAGDGILFLDEIGELSPELQAKLLRLLEERSFTRLGGERSLTFSARVLAASNADLPHRVTDGRFRADLFHRLNVIPVHIPSLAERPADIGFFAEAFTREFAALFDRPARRLSPRARFALDHHTWPGNVRELRNRIERAVALAAGPTIDADDLFPEAATAAGSQPSTQSLQAIREDAERAHISTVLAETGGQIGEAARRLAVSRTTLWDKMRRLGLTADPEN